MLSACAGVESALDSHASMSLWPRICVEGICASAASCAMSPSPGSLTDTGGVYSICELPALEVEANKARWDAFPERWELATEVAAEEGKEGTSSAPKVGPSAMIVSGAVVSASFGAMCVFTRNNHLFTPQAPDTETTRARLCCVRCVHAVFFSEHTKKKPWVRSITHAPRTHGLHPKMLVLPLLLMSALRPSPHHGSSKRAPSQDWRVAVAHLREASQHERPCQPADFGRAFKLCGSAGKWQEALSLVALLEAKRSEDHGSAPRPYIIAFTEAIQACGRAGRWWEARSVLERMEAAGISADTRAYNAVLSACARARAHAAMVETFEQMHAAGVARDKASYTIAVNGAGRAGHPEVALELFARMGRDGAPPPDEVSYGAAIDACARASRWNDALMLLKRMRGDSNVALTIDAATGAMTACTNANRHAVAIGLFERLESMGLEVDTVACGIAMAALSRAQGYGGALRLFSAMRRHYGLKRDVVTYNTLLHACATDSRRRLGERHAWRARALMQREAVRADDVTYSVLLQGLWHSPEAAALMDEAMDRKSSAFARCLRVSTPTHAAGREVWALDLHLLSPGAAVAMTLWVLSQLAKRHAFGDQPLPSHVRLITGWGKSHKSDYQSIGRRRGAVRAAVLATIRVCDVPTIPVAADIDDVQQSGQALEQKGVKPEVAVRPTNRGVIELDAPRLGDWIAGAISSGLIRGWFGKEERLIIGLREEHVTAIQQAADWQSS